MSPLFSCLLRSGKALVQHDDRYNYSHAFNLICSNTALHLKELALATLLFQPALVLIDFGHFQYNSVMLGN